MFDAIVHIEIGEVDGVRFVVSCEQLGHVPRDEDAEGWRDIIRIANGMDELAVRNTATIACYDPCDIVWDVLLSTVPEVGTHHDSPRHSTQDSMTDCLLALVPGTLASSLQIQACL